MSQYKKFVKIILLIIIVLSPLTQFVLFKFTPIYNLNLYSKLYDDANWVNGHPKVLIMGSSHAKYHIIPSLIVKMNDQYQKNDIVNIGENAATPFEMFIAYNKQKKKFNNLETVYCTLEPHMLSEKYYTYKKYEKIFLSYEQWKYLSHEKDIENEYFFPFQTFVQSLKIRIKDRSKENGFASLKHQEFKFLKKGEVSKELFTPLNLFHVSKFQIEYLQKLKTQFEKRGVNFVFILTPSFDWTKHYKKECATYDTQLVNLLNQKLGKSKIIGSLWGEDFNLSYNDYKDNTHLAYSGAVKFTNALFSNIERHQHITSAPIKNLYRYRINNEKR